MVDTSPLRYVGGKTRAIKFLQQYIPRGTTEMVSPFIGGGSFELDCASRGIQVKAYDSFLPLTDFWFYLIEEPELLANSIEAYYDITHDELRKWSKQLLVEEHPLMRAIMFFILNRTTFGGTTINGGLYTNLHDRFTHSIIERIRKTRIKNLTVDHLDFRQTLIRHKTELMYLDPPYVGQDRLYAYSKIFKSVFPHEWLATQLALRKGPWFLSYNEHKTIRALYHNHNIVKLKWKYGISNESKSSSEVLITSNNLYVS